VVVLAVSCSACQVYIAKGLASTRASSAVALTAVVSAYFGASLTERCDSKTLKRLFGGWLLVVSVLIFAKVLGLTGSNSMTGAGATVAIAPLLVLGIFTGFCSGLLGIGGGTVLVPALTLAMAFPQNEAQGCAVLGMLLPAAISMSTHWRRSNVDHSLAAPAALGALVGGAGGSLVATHLPEHALRIVFATVLSCVGAKYMRHENQQTFLKQKANATIVAVQNTPYVCQQVEGA